LVIYFQTRQALNDGFALKAMLSLLKTEV